MNLRRVAKVVFVMALTFGAGMGAGLAFGYHRWRPLTAPRFERQTELILNRSKDMPAGGIVVFGDSIVERQRLDSLCGLPTFNAGIGSARLSDIVPVVSPVIAKIRPGRAVVEIGPNDFLVPSADKTNLTDFMQRFDKLLDELGPKPIVVGMTLPTKEQAPEAAAANLAMKKAAEQHGGQFVEGVPEAMTEDGLHLGPLGLSEWKQRVSAACSAPGAP